MTRRRASQLVGAVMALLIGLAAPVLVAAPAAQAHATIVGTVPANDAELEQRPTEVRVSFDEAVSFTARADAVAVIDQAGERFDAGTPRLEQDRTVLVIPLDPALPRDAYIASWSVVSADAHPIGGSIQFGYGAPASALNAPAPPEPSAALALLAAIVKGLLYLALTAAFGLLPAARILAATSDELRPVRRAATVGVAAAVLLSIAQTVVQYFWVNSGGTAPPPAQLWAGLPDYAASSYGILVGVRVLALLTVLGLLRSAPAHSGIPNIALGLVVLATVAANGHGGAGAGWLLFSTVLHGAAAIAWIGSIAVLGWFLLRGRMTSGRLSRMPAFSLSVGVAVAVVVASGLLQSVVQVVYPEALLSTGYGVLLLLKLLLVVAAAAIGASGFVWARRELRDTPDGRPRPGRTARLRIRVRWEVAATVVVVLLSGLLSSITPARDDFAPTATAATEIGPYQVDVEVGPTRLGPETFRITATGASAADPVPQRIEVVLSQAAGPVRDLEVEFPFRLPGDFSASAATPITFVSSAVNVPATGRWIASVTVVAGPTDQFTAAIPFEVR